MAQFVKAEIKSIAAAAASWLHMGDMKAVDSTTAIYRQLGWNVVKEQLFTANQEPTETYATIRLQPQPDGSTRRIILGDKLSEQYKIIQNAEAINDLAPLWEQGLTPCYAGSIDGGKRIAIAASFADALVVGKSGNDVIYRYVMYSNDHTGKASGTIELVGKRQVCSNGATVGSNARIRVMHKGKAEEAMRVAIQSLDVANRQFLAYGERLESLMELPIRKADIAKYVKLIWFPKLTDKELDEKRERVHEVTQAVEKAFVAGPGADTVEAKGTAYGLYQAANYYLNHETRGARDVSLLWGGARNTDLRALELAGRLQTA